MGLQDIMVRHTNIKDPQASAERIAAAEEKAAKLTDDWKAALERSDACKAEVKRLEKEYDDLKDGKGDPERSLAAIKKDLDAARAAAKVAYKKLRQAHSLAREENTRAQDVKEQERRKVVVSDGYVLDAEGNRLRPYGRFERFVDNKVLAFGTLILAFAIMVGLIIFMAFFVNK